MSLPRFDRLISILFSGSLPGENGRSAGQRLPILMYHSVSNEAEPGLKSYYHISTNPARFSEHLDWLSELGYTGMALEEAVGKIAAGTLNGTAPVALTFDDGFQDFHEYAWPALQRHGFTATVYLPTALISNERKAFRGKECLTWREVCQLRQQGIRFGSHTVNHPTLYQLPWSEIEYETRISKQRIEQELQEEVTSFAYPFAFPQEDDYFRGRLRGLLSNVGYTSCVTTMIGRAQVGDDPYSLKRLPASSFDDKALFAAKLSGAYDWVGQVQRVFRCLKKRRKGQAKTN